jgi:5'-3' exonuclease
MKQKLIIDSYNLFFRTIFIADSQGRRDYMSEIEIFSYWKHLTINSIMALVNKKDYDEVIMAYDNRKYWRHDIYPAYKANRKQGRTESSVNFENFMPELDQFITDLNEHFGVFKHLKVFNAEADDIAAVLAKKFSKEGDSVTIVTSDKDYNQLLKYKNVTIYNPIKRKNVNSMNPQKELKIKCVMGDRGDNIFAVKPLTGIKKATKMVEDGTIDDIMLEYYKDDNGTLTEEEKQIANKFKLNTELIDFDHIPAKVTNDILSSYNNFEYKKFDTGKTIIWMNNNGMFKLASEFLKSGSIALYKLQNKQCESPSDLF